MEGPAGHEFVQQDVANLTLQLKGTITARGKERKNEEFVGISVRVCGHIAK